MQRMKINPSRPFLILAVMAALVLPAPRAMALIGMTIDSGDDVHLNITGDIDLHCDDVVVNGTLYMDSGVLNNVGNMTIGATGKIYLEDGTIHMTGNWDNNGGLVDAHTGATTGSTVERQRQHR